MPQFLSKIYTHIVFSTKNRQNLIDERIESHLYNYLGGACKKWECNPVQVGGYKNHVHILCQISRKIAPVDLIQEIKQSSSKWVKTNGDEYATFYWQDGYGVFSVSPSGIERLVRYIRHQHMHHQKMSFEEEYRKLLKRYQVDYDERYVWG